MQVDRLRDERLYLGQLRVQLPPDLVRSVVSCFLRGASQYEVYRKQRLVSKGTAHRLWSLWQEGKLASFESRTAEKEVGTPSPVSGESVPTQGRLQLADPTLAPYRDAHWQALRELAEALRQDLQLPLPGSLFIPGELPPKGRIESNRNASHSPGLQSIVIWIEGGQMRAKLKTELDPRLPHLVAHLGSEFAEWKNFGKCKEELEGLMVLCHQLSAEIFRKGMALHGVTESLPAFVFRLLVETPAVDGRLIPEMEVREDKGRLYRLIPVMQPDLVLAYDYGQTGGLEPCMALIVNLVKNYFRDERVVKIREAAQRVSETAQILRDSLALVSERGSFSGICAVCRTWFIQAHQTP